MLLAPPFHPSPIFLTDVGQFQQDHAQGQFGVIGEVRLLQNYDLYVRIYVYMYVCVYICV